MTSDTRQAILAFMRQPDYTPMKRTALQAALDLDRAAAAAVGSVLRELVRDGIVVKLKKKGYALAGVADLVGGPLILNRRQAGFVTDSASGKTVFVPPGETGTAFSGDLVLVRLDRTPRRSAGGDLPTGAVIRILERRRHTLVGVLRRRRRLFYVEPLHATIHRDVLVAETGGAIPGDRVLVRLDEWDDPLLNPEGVITEVIGPEDDPSLDTLAVLRAFELDPAFPADVVVAAETAPTEITESIIAGREDLRRTRVFTIDPATARDHDDALSVEPAGDGCWEIGVHIADVSHFIRPGTALDREARRRGTSVYLTDQVVPMLPEQLSNGVCSLSPGADRLTMSVFITLDAAATVRNVRLANAVIHSRHRLSYEQALAMLDAATTPAGSDAELVRRLRCADRLAQALRQARFQDGALNLTVPEVQFVIAADGHVDDIVPRQQTRAHQLVEEFMVLANEIVCRHLSKRGVPHLHRIHEEPDPENIAELEEMFRAGGVPRVGSLAQKGALNAVLSAIAGHPQEYVWNVAVLRAMKKASYAPTPAGHFGLAKRWYDHFTSPIRRYPDLIVHRILKAVLAGKTAPLTSSELAVVGDESSAREQNALAAGREYADLKRLRFFNWQLQQGQPRHYDAVVTRVVNFGLFVDVPGVQAFGMVHVSQLGDDFYDFDEGRLALVGRRTGATFSVGTPLTVVIAKVDMQKRFLDFVPASAPASAPPTARRGGRGRRPPRPRGKPRTG